MINTSRLQLLNNLEKGIRSLGAYTRDTSRGLQLLMEWDKSHKTVYPCFYDYLVHIQRSGESNEMVDSFLAQHKPKVLNEERDHEDNEEKEIDTISLLPIDKEERKTKKNAKRTRLSRIISLIFCCVGLRVDKEPNMEETFVAIDGDKLELLERRELETEENHSL